jgi:hypothetical protein
MIKSAVLAGSGSRSTAEVSYKIDILGKGFSDGVAQLNMRGMVSGNSDNSWVGQQKKPSKGGYG